MFGNILNFELKYRLKRPATWAYFGILLVAGFILTANGANAGSEKAFANSAVTVTNLLMTISIFGTLIASAVMGVPVYRDIEHGVKDYYLTYPISEKSYLLGRYTGSMITLLFISLGLVLGMMIGYGLGPVLGWEEAERFGPLRIGDYVYGTLTFLWPNLLLTGTIFFCLVALTRKIFVSYVGSILFFIVYLVALTLASDIENQELVSILDPFGGSAFLEKTKYLTPPEQNTYHVPLTGNLLINRLLWPALAMALLLFTLFRFDFARFLGGGRQKVKKKATAVVGAAAGPVSIPKVEQSFVFSNYVRHMFSQAWIEFKSILRDPYFAGIISGALLFLFLDGWFGNSIYGTPSYPTTYIMLEMKNATYIFFVLIIIVFYTGEVVHRDRTVKFDQISDALPLPNWAIYGGKLLTMFLVTFLLVTMVWVVGIISQTVQGYPEYDFGQYFTDLYLLTWPQYLVLMSLAFFVHVLVNKKFLGHVVAIGIYAAIFFIPSVMEINYNMFLFGSRPGYTISDMNGFGHFLKAVTTFNVYWMAFGAILLILGGLFWARGTDNAWKSRFQRFGQAWGLKPALGILGALAIFAFSGFTIYRNVSVENTYSTPEENFDRQEDYERTYRDRYLTLLQPKITDTEIFVDLVPEERNVTARGVFQIENKGDARIDTLMLNFNFSRKVATMPVFKIDGKQLEPAEDDTRHNLSFYHLPDPLEPGETATMEMVVEGGFDAFPNEGTQRSIVFNGTFLNNSIFPNFGYLAQGEIGSDLERKKRDLEIRDYSSPPATDTLATRNTLFDDDADVVSFRATLSTAPDQIAIAPGKLIREYEKDGRRYFEYANEGKMANFYNISSASYEVAEETVTMADGKEVKVQVFHHPEHDRNIDRFLASAKLSLEYFTDQFSPFQFDQLRILEFPRYASFAQSFPNTVPYAESFGWTGNFSDPTDNDYAFTVTAHEVAHQWWGHQILPSATRGANQISETMAEYSSLMVTKKRYGEAAMGKFLKYELDSYLRGRAGENKFEKTLLDNDTQTYVWYRKGGLIMYALSDYIGEERLNEGFAAMLDSFALKENGPFATTADWYGYIKSVTPDSLHYFLEESFEEITLYENRALEATYNTEATAEGKYKVTLKVDTRKIIYEGSGEEKSRPTTPSLIEIGVFGEDGYNEQGLVEKQPLFLEKRWLTPGEHTIEILVDEVPVKAGIDPYNKLIDRVSDDNLIDVDAE